MLKILILFLATFIFILPVNAQDETPTEILGPKDKLQENRQNVRENMQEKSENLMERTKEKRESLKDAMEKK
ncbi:hypothetical protein HYW87_01955, partial [Candidatus Roizmanbacteria bacterium]|nr:hypothetical protein [Candidatus Roizmanbacteria bacterium]